MGVLDTRLSLRAVVPALLVALLGAAITAITPLAAFADDDLVRLDQVTPDQTLTTPSLITTWGGVSLVAWSRSGSVHRVVVKRAVGSTGKWTSSSVAMGDLTFVSGVRLLDDPQAKRTFLVAEARGADLATTLGTYVWVSTNQGTTWSGPFKVWDSFGTSYAALDGQGGLYLLVNQTGAQVAHVPADLTMQRFYEHEWSDLGGRLGSRGYLDLAAAGASRTMLLSFQDSAGNAWVQRPDPAGSVVEQKTYSRRYGPVPVAGDLKSAAVGAIRAWPGNGNEYRVYVRSLNPATLALGPVKQLSPKHEAVSTLSYQLQHLVVPHAGPTGRLLAVWVRDDGALRYAKSMTANPSGKWSKPISVKKAKHGKYGRFTFPSTNQYWTVALGYRTKKAKSYPVMIATRVGTDH